MAKPFTVLVERPAYCIGGNWACYHATTDTADAAEAAAVKATGWPVLWVLEGHGRTFADFAADMGGERRKPPSRSRARGSDGR